jgi:hypothetical protein
LRGREKELNQWLASCGRKIDQRGGIERREGGLELAVPMDREQEREES